MLAPERSTGTGKWDTLLGEQPALVADAVWSLNALAGARAGRVPSGTRLSSQNSQRTPAQTSVCQRIVHFTGYEVNPADIEVPTEEERTLGWLLGTADLIAQEGLLP